MSRFALVGKETYELLLERRLLFVLLLVAGFFSIPFGVMMSRGMHSPASPLEFLEVVQYVGPLIVGLLAVALAGDAVARERQDRTLHLLFTAPTTITRYWAALLIAHLMAFVAFAALLVLVSLLVGAVMGWVVVKGALVLLGVSLLPLFLTIDLLVLACSARLASGRTSLLVALVLVVVFWSTSVIGPFGWALNGLPWWSGIAAWHPFDVAGSSARDLLERGSFSVGPVLKGALETGVVGVLSWVSLATREVGR